MCNFSQKEVFKNFWLKIVFYGNVKNEKIAKNHYKIFIGILPEKIRIP